ncbi:MAG: hypothetical protein QF363_10025 [Planctomycetaceae bacterium]|nr:hypothetical protein [Planctomycetaceae bacterium]
MKCLLITGLWISLALSPCDAVVAGSVRANRPIDIELDKAGSLAGMIMPTGSGQVAVFRGRQLVARTIVTDGNFLVRDLRGGFYRVVVRRWGQAIRAWDHGTAPPWSSRHVVVSDIGPVTHQATVHRSQSPVGMTVQPFPAPSLPFQPYPVPGRGMIMPGPYLPPGALFLDPLVTTAAVTGIGSVVITTIGNDGDRASTRSGFSPHHDHPPASP